MASMFEMLGYGLMMIAAAAFWIWWGEKKQKILSSTCDKCGAMYKGTQCPNGCKVEK